jgi:hypothetical protein
MAGIFMACPYSQLFSIPTGFAQKDAALMSREGREVCEEGKTPSLLTFASFAAFAKLPIPTFCAKPLNGERGIRPRRPTLLIAPNVELKVLARPVSCLKLTSMPPQMP